MSSGTLNPTYLLPRVTTFCLEFDVGGTLLLGTFDCLFYIFGHFLTLFSFVFFSEYIHQQDAFGIYIFRPAASFLMTAVHNTFALSLSYSVNVMNDDSAVWFSMCRITELMNRRNGQEPVKRANKKSDVLSLV